MSFCNLFLLKISALQSDMRSLKAKMKECVENEQRALEECRTLQKAVKHQNVLESTLMKKENHIKALEAEVWLYYFSHVFMNAYFIIMRGNHGRR